jgi:Asp-tRNA(Asn)/Glu-tRNA(Gln) amidotransferase A subunit family amidase
MPTGLMVIGDHFEEEKIINFGRSLNKKRKWKN